MSEVTEDRVVFNVTVGEQPPEKVAEYIKKVKADLKQKRAQEESGGAPASKSILLQESAA